MADVTDELPASDIPATADAPPVSDELLVTDVPFASAELPVTDQLPVSDELPVEDELPVVQNRGLKAVDDALDAAELAGVEASATEDGMYQGAAAPSSDQPIADQAAADGQLPEQAEAQLVAAELDAEAPPLLPVDHPVSADVPDDVIDGQLPVEPVLVLGSGELLEPAEPAEQAALVDAPPPPAGATASGSLSLFDEDVLFTSDETAERDQAAARMQARVRGRAARQQRAPPPPPPRERPPPGAHYAEEDLAATRMQAAMRGRAARAQTRRVAVPPNAQGSGHAAHRQSASAAHCAAAAASASMVSPGRSSCVSAVAPGALSPTTSAPVGFCSESEYEDRMSHIRKLKREAEERRQREVEIRRIREEKYRKAMEAEAEAMKAREAERERELAMAKEEARKRSQGERQRRLAEREELRQKEREMARRRRGEVPLYKRMEEKAMREAAEAERERETKLADNKGKFQPIDFSTHDVELPVELYEHPKEGQRHFVMPRKRADVTEPGQSLPPIKAYYHGKARERVVQELKEQRHKVELSRQKAQKDKEKALQYSKLVSELAPPPPPPPSQPRASSASTKLPPVSDPARGASRRKPDSASAATSAAHAPRPSRLPPANGEAGVRSRADVKAQEERFAAFNRELSAREQQLRGQIRAEPKAQDDMPPADVEAMLRVRNDLSACYIGAIKSKVEMLEGFFE